MARPKKAAEIHDITGSYTRNPQRRPQNSAKPKGELGNLPKTLPETWRKCWDELVSLVCPGVLGDSDSVWLERAARLLAKSRTDPDNFTGANEAALITYLGKMGMNPSDRQKITVSKPDGESPADAYF